MSIDWIIGWPKKKDIDPELRDYMKRPDVQVIREVLEDYFNGLSEEIEADLVLKGQGYITVKLKGTKNHMFKRHGGVHLGVYDEGDRWLEVFVSKKGMRVTTRMQDDVTNALAENFARRCAQRWDGSLDEPS